MNCRTSQSDIITPPLAAILYEHGPDFDFFIYQLAYDLRLAGHRLAGVAQTNPARQRPGHCDMMLEDLATGKTLLISEDRGPEARGCRLNTAALADASMTIRQNLSNATDLLLINKFGKAEAEGGGLRDVIAEAASLCIPTLIGLPARNQSAWQDFCGHDAALLPPQRSTINQWLKRNAFIVIADQPLQ